MKTMDYYTAAVAGIEVFVVGWEPDAPRPVVFLTHGRTGSISGTLAAQAPALVEMGLTVVGIDQRNHGRRLINQRLNGDWRAEIPSAMYGIIVGTACDVSLLIDMLPAQIGLSMDHGVGMMGGSLGGHAVLMAMAMDRRIDVGAAMVPSGDYRMLMTDRMARNETPAEQFDEFYPPALDAAVRKFDPIHNASAFADRPLCMTCGGKDEVVPPATARSFYEAARSHYSDPERIVMTVYDEAGHATPPEALAQQLAWLGLWLIEPGAGASA
jgi:alpha-beta hydrolase superfamily lysophospholipase